LAVYGNSNSKGRFYAVLPAKADYGLSVTKKGYLFYSKNFALSERNRMEALELLVELIPIESGQKVILENIFFDYDSYDLSVKSDQEIQEIFRFLTLNPDMKVRLEGHTDDQGGKDYNAKLSLNRARTVHDRLIAMGILANRISFIGLGSTKPIVPNDSEANRARNRRTELHIR
jgi:outer membrane protein OmpA-like peptidoglycan-associated protein